MSRQFTRFSRIEEKKAYRRLFFSLIVMAIILFSLIFFAIPGIIKLSEFLANSREATNSGLDNIAPLAPKLEAAFMATNSANMTISGFAEANSQVEIFLNQESIKKIILGTDGQFNLNEINLKEGENKVTAIARDNANNLSPASNPLIIIYKKSLPKLVVDKPEPDQKISGEKKETLISGSTDSTNTLSINNRFVMVKNDGSFEFILSLQDGENQIKIIATDIAGNQKTIERKITYSP